MRFFIMMLTAFFARVKPVSTMAKPACMSITRNAQMRTQVKFTGAKGSSASVAAPEESAAATGVIPSRRRHNRVAIPQRIRFSIMVMFQPHFIVVEGSCLL